MTTQEAVPAPEAVAAFVSRLHQRGVRLSVTGEPGRERLRVQAPEGRLSADDRQRLARWKDAIIALLGEGAGAGAGGDAAAAADIGEASDVNAPCPRCRALEAQAAEVMAQLRASPALPPALRSLPPAKLAVLLRWAVVSLSNPRPQWPPRPPTAAQRKHRPGLDSLIESLGGRPAGAEPEPPPPEELDDGAIAD